MGLQIGDIVPRNRKFYKDSTDRIIISAPGLHSKPGFLMWIVLLFLVKFI
jgi:hypothetical protein